MLKKLARLYSAIPEDLPALTEKLFQERASQARENDLLRDRLLDMEAEGLLQTAARTERGLLVCRTFTDRRLDAIKILAQKLTANSSVVAILGMQDACQIVVARSRNLPENCGEAIKKTAAELGGKGGGRPELAQAGGFPAESFEPWMKTLQKYFGY
jgi:alanyl-tRNA synthetase